MGELTPENSFVCEECGRHLMDGNMSIISCTKHYEGLICMDCASIQFSKQVEQEARKRDREWKEAARKKVKAI